VRSPQYPGSRCQSAYDKAPKISRDPLESRTILLDCRWLERGGAGRATELVLRGLSQLDPPGRWLLWGGDPVRSLAWDRAQHVRTDRDPRDLAGQAQIRRMPPHDVALFMHQIRPLRPGRSVTIFHDTIPLRHGGSAPTRLLKRIFFGASARLSTRILTGSAHAKRSLVADLGVRPDKIGVVTYPVDERLVERVHALRGRLGPTDVAFYVGSFARHKNLERLVSAFPRTRFAANGGRLLLVGEESARAEALRARGGDRVDVEGPCSQERLDELYATARLLVMPSLEEGFGLPAWEAVCCGLPVAASNATSLPEATRGLGESFDPTSETELAAAIDRAVDYGARGQVPADAPTVADFAAQFVAAARVVAHT
jgi:glycosyltransferase involved in cell wall biosynthesis